MRCPVYKCEFTFTGSENSEPYLAFEVLKHIINTHTLVERT